MCTVCEATLLPLDDEWIPRGPGDPLDGVARAYRYTGRAEQAVHRLKYSRVTSLADPMAGLMKGFLAKVSLLDADAFVPVPIHWTRRCFRGFNQSDLLCLDLPASAVRKDLVRRVRATRPQVGLSPEERRRNLADAFEASAEAEGQTVVLLDDVLTSGYTAFECAKALKAKGALKVFAVAFAGG